MNRATARELQAQQIATNERLDGSRGERERELTKFKAEQERELTKFKAEQEERLKSPERAAAKIFLRQFFNNPKYPGRTRAFDNIKKPLPIFDDGELKRILVSMGAHQVTVKSGREGWHLPDMQEEDE